MSFAVSKEPEYGPFYVKFYPHLQSYFGSSHVPLIMGRLEYWFQNKKFQRGFFKFLEPCDHPLYRGGDSWVEEIGVGRKLFNKAFDLIGTRYKSKSAYLAESDPFKGKLYASYYDRKTNKMFYIRNHDFAEAFLKSIFQRKTSENSSSTKSKIREKGRGVEKENISSHTINEQFSEPSKPTPQSSDMSRSWNGQNGRSRGGIIGGNNIYTKQKTTLISQTPDIQQSTEELPSNPKKGEEIKKIWDEEVGIDDNVSPTKSFYVFLERHWVANFDQSLEKWRAYCKKIASSKFLMGEATNTKFKAWLRWAIQENGKTRIEAGEFVLGDRKTQEKLMREEEARSAARQRYILQSQREQEEREKRWAKTKAINEAYHQLSSKELSAYWEAYRASEAAQSRSTPEHSAQLVGRTNKIAFEFFVRASLDKNNLEFNS